MSESPLEHRQPKPPASRSGIHIELDPEVAEHLKAARDRRLHAEQIPRLRLIGFTFFAIGVGLHNWLILEDVSWPTIFRFAAVLVAYSLATRLVVQRLYGRTGPIHIGDLFLVVDIGFLVAAVYLSGGDRSWIFFILLMRVADQAIAGFRRALVFSHLCVAGYIVMLVWIAVVDGRSLELDAVIAKTIFLYLGAIYIALCALPVARRREAIGTAVRTARGLISRLQTTMTALEDARLRAEEASESKSQFLATMSHELRTPLSAVIGMADLLEGTRLDDEQREMLGFIRSGADTTVRLVSDLLTLADLESGRTEVEWTLLTPTAVVHDVEEAFHAAAAAKGLALETAVDEMVPERILGDPRRLRHLLSVLVDNAVKFTDAGSVEIRCSTVGATTYRPVLRWSVRDTGIGFPVEDFPRLLQNFTQADASTTRRYDGAGLGLALAFRLARAMGGSLGADSSPGCGATVWTDVPSSDQEPTHVET